MVALAQSRHDAELFLLRVHLDDERQPAGRDADARPVPRERRVRGDVPLPARALHLDDRRGPVPVERDGHRSAADRRRRRRFLFVIELFGLGRRDRRSRRRRRRAPAPNRPRGIPHRPPPAPEESGAGSDRIHHGAAPAGQGIRRRW